MFRWTSIILLLIFIAQTVGVALSVPIPTLSYGHTVDVVEKPVKKFSFSQQPLALLSKSTREDYESLVFVGDVLLARNVEYLMRTKGGEYPFVGFDLSSISSKPAVVGNFEASVPLEHTPTPIGQINFSVPVTSLKYLSKGKFTHFSLANNHSFDYGKQGLESTIDSLSQHVSTFGHPNEVSNLFEVIELKEKSVALVGLNALLPLDENDLRKVMRQASRKTDYQIVYVHWGEEYALRQNSAQRELAEIFVSAGADLIIGHHPHVVQGVDLIEGVPVFYSLGNYIFDQYFSKDVQEGLVLSLNFDSGISISLVPVTSKGTLSQPQPMSDKAHLVFLESLARKSHTDLNEAVKLGLINSGVEIASSPKVAIIQGTEAYVQ